MEDLDLDLIRKNSSKLYEESTISISDIFNGLEQLNRNLTMDKIQRIEEYLEQAEFDLETYKEYMDKSDTELKCQEGIIRGLSIALRILNSEK